MTAGNVCGPKMQKDWVDKQHVLGTIWHWKTTVVGSWYKLLLCPLSHSLDGCRTHSLNSFKCSLVLCDPFPLYLQGYLIPKPNGKEQISAAMHRLQLRCCWDFPDSCLSVSLFPLSSLGLTSSIGWQQQTLQGLQHCVTPNGAITWRVISPETWSKVSWWSEEVH